MGLYVYAIADEPRALDGLVGVQKAELASIEHAGLTAVVSEVEIDPFSPAEDDLWTHESVVEALMEEGDVLPMRFGTVVEEDALIAMLEGHAGEVEQSLARVRGAVEVGVRAILADAQTEPPRKDAASGSEYLLGRLEFRRRIEQTARRVHDSLAALSRESSFRIREEGAAQLQSAYLLDRGLVDAFKERAEQLERDRVITTLACTGPWPPYSFTGLRLQG
jgi:Gas vesicle synthesis protein GvpL/GvpF